MSEPHLKPKTTDRGFKHMPSIPAVFPDTRVRVYESSNAEEPCMWLAAESDPHEVIVQLTVEHALRLADQIQYLASNHYQLRN